MPLDPRAQRLLSMLSASTAGPAPQSVEARRNDLASLSATVGGEPPPMAAVDDLQPPGPGGPLPVRRYRPFDAGDGAVLFFHGGGWVAGSLDTHDGVCRRLAKASGCQVFAVDYRLAPEHPFPAGLDDAAAAIAWLSGAAADFGVDPAKLVVAGDSAGGTLAAAACLQRPGSEPSIALLLLICPILDVAEESASRVAFAQGYFLSAETMAQDLLDYAPKGTDPRDARLSPLYAADLSSLPPTHVHVAEFDPFRDEGLAFAARRTAAGGEARATLHPGMIHYFYAMPGAIPYAEAALAQIGDAVRRALSAKA